MEIVTGLSLLLLVISPLWTSAAWQPHRETKGCPKGFSSSGHWVGNYCFYNNVSTLVDHSTAKDACAALNATLPYPSEGDLGQWQGAVGAALPSSSGVRVVHGVVGVQCEDLWPNCNPDDDSTCKLNWKNCKLSCGKCDPTSNWGWSGAIHQTEASWVWPDGSAVPDDARVLPWQHGDEDACLVILNDGTLIERSCNYNLVTLLCQASHVDVTTTSKPKTATSSEPSTTPSSNLKIITFILILSLSLLKL